MNLYAFVGNDGINYWDRLGLVKFGGVNVTISKYKLAKKISPKFAVESSENHLGELNVIASLDQSGLSAALVKNYFNGKGLRFDLSGYLGLLNAARGKNYYGPVEDANWAALKQKVLAFKCPDAKDHNIQGAKGVDRKLVDFKQSLYVAVGKAWVTNTKDYTATIACGCFVNGVQVDPSSLQEGDNAVYKKLTAKMTSSDFYVLEDDFKDAADIFNKGEKGNPKFAGNQEYNGGTAFQTKGKWNVTKEMLIEW